MNKFVGTLVLGLATLGAACIDAHEPSPDPENSPVAGGTVNGSKFECTGNWPSNYTPCNYPWSTEAKTTASGSDGLVTLHLGRNHVPNEYEGFPDCGGGSFVFIDLDFNTPDDAVRASGREVTFSPDGSLAIIETSDPVSGYILPIVLSRTPEGRNTGTFSLTFPWGAIEGSYDTDPPAP
jgi:hypothetical protein